MFSPSSAQKQSLPSPRASLWTVAGATQVSLAMEEAPWRGFLVFDTPVELGYGAP